MTSDLRQTSNSQLYLKRAEEALAEVDLSGLSNAELIAYAQATASIAAAGSLLRIDEDSRMSTLRRTRCSGTWAEPVVRAEPSGPDGGLPRDVVLSRAPA
ncbi:hypothetical protein [Parafrankia sp. EUN1f]|uniref:hypothetical protein n=1 Tax=Parafrankia sp. EUN1f TaxID=102897 RepID=UPI0003092B2E|nr:hypothetical protein [Parafrankia sp. EUN1f]